MEDPSSSGWSSTTITDLDMDTLTRCASYLSLRDISNMAMSSKYLKTAAYSDAIWQSLYSQKWPKAISMWSRQASSIREDYLSRHTALHQFKYLDPLLRDIYRVGKPPHHILFEKNRFIFSQGSSIYTFDIDAFTNRSISPALLGDHNARVTCMRLFSLGEPYMRQSVSERDDNILITSSSDHSIRLWSKGGSRCFRGHAGPVLTLSDKLLGDDTGRIFASGGEDCTVRLWSISSSGKRGQHALKGTLHGHEKAVSLMSVAGHKAALLVSISKNGKVRVWDTTTASSSIRSSCCVGMTSVPVSPVAMKCHDSLLYVAAGSSVVAVDLRTMSRVFTLVQHARIHSFEFLPSKSLLCTGGVGRANLWDTRKVSDTFKAESAIELSGHEGPVKLLRMDFHRVVTGGPDDPCVRVWEPDTGTQTNALLCSDHASGGGCSAMAVNGCRIVTSSTNNEDHAILRFRDFKDACILVSPNASEAGYTVSKFWGAQSDSDSEESDGQW